MPEYRFSEKERDMCDSLAQIWTLAENKNLHFKDVKEAEKPEILSELIEKQRQVSGWLHDVASQNENRQDSWTHLQEVGGICRNYLAEMQDVKRMKEQNLIYAGSQAGSTHSAVRLIRGSSRAKARSDEFISSFTNMVDQANQYGLIGPEEEIRIQKNLQSYRKAIVYKGGKAGILPRPFRSSQEEMDRFSAEFDPDIDREMEHLEKHAENPAKGKIPPVPEGAGPVKVEDVPDDHYRRLREAQERVQAQHQREEEAIRRENARLKAEAQRLKDEEDVRAMNARLKAEAERIKAEHEKQVRHQREEEAIRAENVRLKAEAERIRAQQEKEEHEKWVQHEKEEEELRAMNARLKAEAERIKNAQQKAERERQEQQRKAEREKQRQQKEAPRRQEQPNIQQEVPKQPLKEEKAVQAGAEVPASSKEKKIKLQMEARESFSYRAVHAPHMKAVQGLMNRVQYSERILRDVAARLDWMERNPMGQMPYAPLMNSFQRSMAVPVFQAFVQHQDMAQYQNASPYQGMPWQPNVQADWNPRRAYLNTRANTNMQMAYRGAQINYGNPMNPQMRQPVQGQNPYIYGQPVQNQNPYMYSQPVQNQNPYMYSQPMQNQDPYMYSYPRMDRQQAQMQMAYMLQNMSLIRLAITYASISIMETYNQLKGWLSERGKQKDRLAQPDMQAVSYSKEGKIKESGETKAASRSSEKRQISFKDLEKQERLAMGKEVQKKIPMTIERNPLTRQKEKGMTH